MRDNKRLLTYCSGSSRRNFAQHGLSVESSTVNPFVLASRTFGGARTRRRNILHEQSFDQIHE